MFTVQAGTHPKHVSLLLSPQTFVHSAPILSSGPRPFHHQRKRKNNSSFWSLTNRICYLKVGISQTPQVVHPNMSIEIICSVREEEERQESEIQLLFLW